MSTGHANAAKIYNAFFIAVLWHMGAGLVFCCISAGAQAVVGVKHGLASGYVLRLQTPLISLLVQ